MKNPLKADPTRTTGLRKAFLREMGRRFKLLAKDIRKLVVEEDAFNLDLKKPLVIMAMKQFAFQTSEQKVQSFNKWFQGRIDERVLTVDHAGKPWTSKYVDSAYKKGSIRAYTDTHKKSLMKSQDFYEGSKDQFLKSAFMHPERMSKVRLLGTRVFEQLKGVTAEMGAKMNALAAEGIAHGKNPISIARQMAKNISGLTRKRANVIARTEVIYAHAEGQLDSFEDLGVKELGVMAEWSTAGDDRVCPQCSELEGTVMTIEQARGMIPLHPNCRCAWVPANVGEKVRKRRKILEKWGEKGEPVFKSPVSKKKLGIPVPSKPKPKMKPKIKLSPAEELQVDEKLKSIKRVTFTPQEGGTPMEIAKNEKDIREALSLVPPEAVEGMEALKVTGGGEFIGSAMYIPPTKAGGYVSDELWLMEGWLKKSSLGRKQELLHEVGHRMYYVRPDLTREFKKKKLGKYFSSITDPEFAKRYTKAQKAGETFAESFSNHLLKKPQPKELEAFWKKAGVGKVVKAKPIPTLKPKLKPTLKPTLKPKLKPKPIPKPKLSPPFMEKTEEKFCKEFDFGGTKKIGYEKKDLGGLVEKIELLKEDWGRVLKNNPKLVEITKEVGLEHGGVVSKVTFVNKETLGDLGFSKGAKGAFNFGTRRLVLAMQNTAGETLTIGKWVGDGSLQGSFRHELGHALWKNVDKMKVKGLGGDSWASIWKKHNKKWWRDHVSVYGSTNVGEAFAETFSIYTSPAYETTINTIPLELERYFDLALKGVIK